MANTKSIISPWVIGGILAIALLIVVYNKKQRASNARASNILSKYLLNNDSLDADERRPILWIHVPHEYNARHWQSFGSRSSFDLNQPYLYLTVRSIIQQCGSDFTIVIIDDSAFNELLPTWSQTHLSKTPAPISTNLRTLGLLQLLYTFGGVIVPISFLCTKSLLPLWKTTCEEKQQMFVCETVCHTVSATTQDFAPAASPSPTSIQLFCGSPKECPMTGQMCDYMRHLSATDYTAQSAFLGDLNRWCIKQAQAGQLVIVPGYNIGTRTVDDTPILLDHLMSNHPIDFYPSMYGIYIPADQILMRTKYQWYARQSQEQALQCDCILSNHMLITLGNTITEGMSAQEREQIKRKFIGFWEVPSGAPVWGFQPLNLGDNLTKLNSPPPT